MVHYKITASIILSTLLLGGCNSSSDTDDSTNTTDSITTDITVERGKVYQATVTDSSSPAKTASINTDKNIYTFKGTVTYPVHVIGGWIDVDNDGQITTDDYPLDINMSSNSLNVTPITTYLVDNNQTLSKLSQDTGISQEELLKLPSESSNEAIVLQNSIYTVMKKKNSTTIEFVDINDSYTTLQETVNQSCSDKIKDALASCLETIVMKDISIPLVNDDLNQFAPNDGSTITDENTTNISYKDEPYYKYQWYLDSSTYEAQNTAFRDAYIAADFAYNKSVDKNADINITEAWKLSQGADIKVAVIDDGVDVEHEDIKDNLLVAYNADDETTDVSNHSTDSDTALHGNNCAGLIIAPINGKGTVGMAPSAKLIAIKQQSSDDVNTIRAFEYAKNQGAKVISCSWGTENVSEAVVSELKSLYDANITVVFASGNNHKDLDADGIEDESEVEWVIGVGSSGEDNDVADTYSNYGENIDIIAPGGDASNSIGMLILDDSGTQGSKDNYGLVDNNYSFGQGTSYSTPVVAGVVALMYGVNPDITPKQIKDILIRTTDKVGGTNNNYITNSTTNETFDKYRAYGKINAGRAVAAAKALLY